MRLRQVKLEDFVNYKKISLFLGTCFCDWKCCIEQKVDLSVCQNTRLVQSIITNYSPKEIYHDMYCASSLHQAIVFGGLEPMLQFNEMLDVIDYFRQNTQDDIIIYTGYEPTEIQQSIEQIKRYPNIFMKFGRFKLNSPHHIDPVLGVELASENQRGVKIS